jgi:hypothetical protein
MTAITAAPAPSALAQGVALHEAAHEQLAQLLAEAQAWQANASAELGAALDDDETRRRAADLWTLAVEMHADLLGVAGRMRQRQRLLRGG